MKKVIVPLLLSQSMKTLFFHHQCHCEHGPKKVSNPHQNFQTTLEREIPSTDRVNEKQS